MLSICASSRCIGTPARAAGSASKTRTAGEEEEEKEEGACKCSCSSSSFEPPPRSNSKMGGVSTSALVDDNTEEEVERGGGGAGKKREEEGKEEEKKEVKAAEARGWFSWGYVNRYASTPAAKGENATAGKAAAEAKVEHSYLIYYRHYLIYYVRSVPLILANTRQYLCVCVSACSSLRVQSVSAIFFGGVVPKVPLEVYE
jgi:hypothetical protein